MSLLYDVAPLCRKATIYLDELSAGMARLRVQHRGWSGGGSVGYVSI